jgi:hypothetical protein
VDVANGISPVPFRTGGRGIAEKKTCERSWVWNGPFNPGFESRANAGPIRSESRASRAAGVRHQR